MKPLSRHFRFETPELNDVQQRIVDSLRQDGLAVATFRQLLGDPQWAELEADIAPFVRRTEETVRDEPEKLAQARKYLVGDEPEKLAHEKKYYLVTRFWSKKQKEMHRFSFADPWLRVYLSNVVLDIVNSYREQWTKLCYIDNWFTVPYPGSVERVASQRWHRDPEEEHVVKVFLYFSDVDDDAGPFEFIAGSAPGGRYGDLWPWGQGARYPPQDELLAAVSSHDRLTLIGPAGTMIFCDTSGFHRGGFARTKARVLSTGTYVSMSASKSRQFDVDFDVGEAKLSAQARFALE